MPLAIELAAARAKLLPPRQLHDRLERTLTLLTRGDRDAPPRHLTMRDAIAWSYDLLAPEEQRLFRQLAVFAGGFTLDAVEAISYQLSAIGLSARLPDSSTPRLSPSPITHHPSPAPLDRLEALLDQSMVVREVGIDGEPRFRMLETIRELRPGAAARPTEEEEAARSAHAALLPRARPGPAANGRTSHARAPQDRLAADDANLSAALAWLDDARTGRRLRGDGRGLLRATGMAYVACAKASSGSSARSPARAAASPPDQARLLIAAGDPAHASGRVGAGGARLCRRSGASGAHGTTRSISPWR